MRKKIIATKVSIILAVSLNGYAAEYPNKVITQNLDFGENEVYNRLDIGDHNKGGGSATVSDTVLTIHDALDIGWGHRNQADLDSDTSAGIAISKIEDSVFNIKNKGQVKITGSTSGYILNVGGTYPESTYYGFGTGILNIEGEGSSLTIEDNNKKGDVAVGIANGKGIVNITNGGELIIKNGTTLNIGMKGLEDDKYDKLYGAANGIINVDGGLLATNGKISVGVSSSSKNELIIKNGGNVNVGYVIAGEQAPSTGQITVDGEKSIINAERMSIGTAGTGYLLVSNKGTVNVDESINLALRPSTKYLESYIYIGGTTDSSPMEPGTITTPSIKFNNNQGHIVFNHTSSDYDFSTQLDSQKKEQGYLEFVNGVTTISNDNNSFLGMANIYENATLSLGSQYATGKATVTNNGALLVNGEKTIQNLDNSGKIYLSNADKVGATLTINENYSGGGIIEFNTKLEGDESTTDKLVVNGDVTGTTKVVVNNVDGNGASTVEGIELIKTQNSTSDAFEQSGRIVAGNYEYHLQQGTVSGDNLNSWYLTSKYIPDDTSIYRPESGSYISNLQAAGTIFNTTLKDRQGGGTYINPVTGEIYTSSVWVRSVGSHQKGNLSDGQSDFTASKFVYQMGGDVINGALQDNDEYHVGIMAGYANQHNRSHNNLSGYHSKGSLWGYSVGLYGTWYQNSKANTGLYVDSWVLYNWFNNSVHGDELAYENYKSKGFTASVESGYAFNIGSYPSFGETINNVYLTPQAQVIWSNVKAGKHKESNGTEVEGLGNNNVQTRLGLRLSIVNEGNDLEGIPVRPFMPFIEANWIYNSKQYGVSMDNENTYLQGSRNIGEIKAGLEADLSHNVTLWGNIAQQFSSHSYQNTQGMLGLKYAF